MIPTHCSCYLDQGRYIGQDPVGHCCSGFATVVLLSCGAQFPVCLECYGMLVAGTNRISFGPGVVANYLQVEGVEIVPVKKRHQGNLLEVIETSDNTS